MLHSQGTFTRARVCDPVTWVSVTVPRGRPSHEPEGPRPGILGRRGNAIADRRIDAKQEEAERQHIRQFGHWTLLDLRAEKGREAPDGAPPPRLAVAGPTPDIGDQVPKQLDDRIEISSSVPNPRRAWSSTSSPRAPVCNLVLSAAKQVRWCQICQRLGLDYAESASKRFASAICNSGSQYD